MCLEATTTFASVVQVATELLLERNFLQRLGTLMDGQHVSSLQFSCSRIAYLLQQIV